MTVAGYPDGPALSVEQWRAKCQGRGLTESDKPDALKKAFQRAKDDLIKKGLVQQMDGYVWKLEGST
jgi:hypothetical protein